MSTQQARDEEISRIYREAYEAGLAAMRNRMTKRRRPWAAKVWELGWIKGAEDALEAHDWVAGPDGVPDLQLVPADESGAGR